MENLNIHQRLLGQYQEANLQTGPTVSPQFIH